MCEVWASPVSTTTAKSGLYTPQEVWQKEEEEETPASPAAVLPSGWNALPDDILVQVLSHVPPKDRFQHCALVNTSWAAAAVEATDSISLPSRCGNLFNLQSWMVQHGSRVTTISVSGLLGHQEVTLLPCSRLQQLDLSDVTVQLSPITGGLFPGILKELLHLTRLTLQHAAVIGGPDAFTALTVLTHLQHLSLSDLDSKQPSAGPLPLLQLPQPAPAATDWFPVPGELLPRLLQLTHLQLERCVSSSTLQHVSCLTRLRSLVLGRLSLHNTSVAALSGLDCLSKSLEWLAIEGLDAGIISTSSLPALGQLTRLTKLELLNCLKGFQPILLSGMLRLQLLDMQGTPLLGTGPGIELAAAAGGAGAAAEAEEQAASQAAVQAAAGAAALLLELPKLQHLRRLCLMQVLWAHAEGMRPAAYAALTAASSNLQHLDLSFSLVPAAAWRHIFNPALQTLPALTSLNILCSQALIGDEELGLIVQSCPGLKHLGLKGSMQTGAELSALTALGGCSGPSSSSSSEGLTSLSLNHVSSEGAVGVLAELRGLQDLQMSVQSCVGASALLQLTALRGLTRLRVESSPETWIAKYGLLLCINESPAGAPPNVWLQLQKWCLHKIAAAAAQAALAAEAGRTSRGGRRRKEKEEGGWLLRWLVRCVS